MEYEGQIFPLISNRFDYDWNHAIIDIPFYSIVASPHNTVVAGTANPTNINQRGIYRGEWTEEGELMFTRSTIKSVPPDVSHINLTSDEMHFIALASFEKNPNVMYGVCSDDNGGLLALLRSTTGGKSWSLCSNLVTNLDAKFSNLRDRASLGNRVGYNEYISISPHNESLVAVTWRTKLPFISIIG